MNEHSKVPWRVGHYGPSRPIIITADGSMLSISKCEDGQWGWYEQEEADAALIVDAINEIAALRRKVGEAYWKGHENGRLWGKKAFGRDEIKRGTEIVHAILEASDE
jgi:hypothetical protein